MVHLHCLQVSVEELAGEGWSEPWLGSSELRGILGGPECGFLSTCLLQQHRATGHQFSLVFKSKFSGK